MNSETPPLTRRIFIQAAQPGPVRESASVTTALVKFEDEAGDGQFNMVGELEEAMHSEFPWCNQHTFHSHLLGQDDLEAWTQVTRWLMQSLLTADEGAKDTTTLRIQVLLSALCTLGAGNEGLSAVSDYFAGSHIPISILSMLQGLKQIPKATDARSEEWLRELPEKVKAGDFRELLHAQRIFQPQYRSDISAAVFLLWKLDPTALTRLINSRSSILFDLMVCWVLGPDAPRFALQVESVTFKFVSLSWLERIALNYSEADTLDVLEQLLLQVARTPYWKGWLQANHEYPIAGSRDSKALAEALAQLDEPQWEDFISALALSKSPNSAEGVADILVHIANKLDAAKAHPIWLLAFERWNAWDYGKSEEHFHLSSPQVCAFDFPVAMYYSRMMAAERDALEKELQDAILHVEQRWFSNEMELCSERNRLASRLRLLLHGSAIASGSTEALPPPVQPDSEYAEVRYRYHDVNAMLAKTIPRQP